MGTPLSQKDKEHWRELIAKKIDKRIEVIKAQDPGLFDNLGRAANQQALVSLGLADMQQRLDAIEVEKDKLEKEEKLLKRQMTAHLRKVPVDDVDECFGYGYSNRRADEVEKAIKARAAVHLDELYSANPLGQQIVALETEKEEALNTVYLATATAQIKALYDSVLTMLSEPKTHLTDVALKLPPVED